MMSERHTIKFRRKFYGSIKEFFNNNNYDLDYIPNLYINQTYCKGMEK